MKNILYKGSLLLALAALSLLPSCNKNDDDNNNNNNNNSACGGTVVATWKVDGTAYQSQTALTYKLDSSFTLTLAACVSDGVDKTISFEIFHPLSPGSYPLRWKMLHAQVANGYGGADYLIENGTNYFTDSTTNTGTLVVTSMDTVNRKYSGTFEFQASNDSSTLTVHITDGTLTNINY